MRVIVQEKVGLSGRAEQSRAEQSRAEQRGSLMAIRPGALGGRGWAAGRRLKCMQ